ncbi:MAG TPA: integrin alpha [Myxococcota bacterium]|nr:integrin alpha [Myxococcota bacterium]
MRWSVSGGGDLNGDGYPDVAVAAPFGSDGRVYLLYSRPD